MRVSSRAPFFVGLLSGGLHLWSPPAAADDSSLDEVDLEALFEGPVEAATAEVERPPVEATRRELEEEGL